MTGPADPKSTQAAFRPEKHWGLAKLNAVELMVLVSGVALCSTGRIGTLIGIPVALGALYSGFFIAPKFQRGVYVGPCPHCGADMSAMHYQEQVDCPSCGRFANVKDSRFIAAPGPVGKAA